MPDDTTVVPAAGTTTLTIPGAATVPAEPQVTTGQPDADRTDVPPEVKRALHKANKEAEALRLKLKEFEDRDKTDLEKAQSRVAEAEQRATDFEVRATRAEVVAEKSVPANLAKFVTGSTREELEAAADELLAAIPAGKPAGLKPDHSQGARGGETLGKADAGLAEAARRFTKK